MIEVFHLTTDNKPQRNSLAYARHERAFKAGTISGNLSSRQLAIFVFHGSDRPIH